MYRKIIIPTYLVLLVSILLTSFTRLEFAHSWERWAVAILFAGFSPFIFIWLARYSVILKIILLVVFIAMIIISPFAILDGLITSKWETVGIYYRLKSDTDTYVAIQMRTHWINYDRRTVKVQPITPLFNWVTEVDKETFAKDINWKKVDEDYNPFNWKGG